MVPHPASITRVQLLYAMERFALAHEYAHHIGAHGKRSVLLAGTDNTGKHEEYEADLFALSLTRYQGYSETPQNLYSVSGAGAVLLLKCWECVRRARRVLLTGDDSLPPASTHPEVAERITAFRELDPHLPDHERRAFTQIREDFEIVIDAVWKELRPVYIEMHRLGLKPEQSQLATWLPS
jgi:hypothetical protein